MDNRFKDLYMDIAVRTSKMSRAKRLQVGCVAVKDDRIISLSWNGTPSGWDNECEDIVGINPDSSLILKTKPEVLHAEMNCLMKMAKSNDSGNNATLFVTHSPCLDCAKGIFQSGIKEVFYREKYRSDDGIQFLEKCGITIEQYP